MLRKAAICAVMATALRVGGCGDSNDESSAEDEQAITELVAKLNEATREKDASALCLMMQPSGVEETFNGIDRCVRETRAILKAAGEQPAVEVENIEIDGDQANVTFAGSAGGEASFVKEGSQWYLPLGSEGAGVQESGDQ